VTHPNINGIVWDAISRLQNILGQKLVGIYLYGSFVLGAFDLKVSDIDLLVALKSDLDETEFEALDDMHEAIVDDFWRGRLEIAYLSVEGLKTFKTQTSKLGIISPGEPFHIIEAGKDWLMNWYVVQEKGQTLFGPPARTLIDPTSKDEYRQAVRDSLLAWREYIKHVNQRSGQAYAILTMCRGLYTLTHDGAFVSKTQAAEWAAQEFPDWADLIKKALLWRQKWRDTHVDHAATLPETHCFVYLMIDHAAQLP
jgi:hypothetical protein